MAEGNETTIIDNVDMKDTGSAFIYYIMMIIMSGFILGILMANCIYYDRLIKKPSLDISSYQATIMLWLNAIMAGLAGVIFIWSIFMIFSMRSVTARKLVTIASKTGSNVKTGVTEAANVTGKTAFIAAQPDHKILTTNLGNIPVKKVGTNYRQISSDGQILDNGLKVSVTDSDVIKHRGVSQAVAKSGATDISNRSATPESGWGSATVI
jgi:hypothetical protein